MASRLFAHSAQSAPFGTAKVDRGPAVAMPRRAAGGGRVADVGSALLRLQRYHGNRYVQRVIDRARGDAGRALDQRTEAELGQALGADFGHVRVHADGQADRLSRSLNAAAFTVGSDIFFRANHYNPGTVPGKRLLAHELAHVIQQRTGNRAAPGLRLAPADDPGERAADRAADAAVRGFGGFGGFGGGGAQPPKPPLIQRKAFIGNNPATAKRAEIRNLYGETSPGVVAIPLHEYTTGTGERSVGEIVDDARARYFRNRSELYKYAQKQTDDIGWVDREKTWVRLPDQFLVLGERHDGTTLPDLVEATGTKDYVYEAGVKLSEYLYPGLPIPASMKRHSLEELLPKLVVGLIGVKDTLEDELDDLGDADERPRDWKAAIRAERATVEREKPDAGQPQYEADLAAWSSAWEAANVGAEARGWRKTGIGGQTVGARKTQYVGANVLVNAAPNTPYSRTSTEVRLTRMALEELRATTRGKNDAVTRFYAQNKYVIDKTIDQLKEGLPVRLTRMFLKFATGKFNLDNLISVLSGAAEKELTYLGVPDISQEEGYNPTYETIAAGHRMEELRDSYMLYRILQARQDGDRLAGLGDRHRRNLEPVLARLAPDIIVRRWIEFYSEQYTLHPDRPGV